ncbi:MAG: CsgG/HfaB family protein [Bacteroidales bacterium]|nr:CsgG/HfaB family protein [Bacteroidales bacterium]
MSAKAYSNLLNERKIIRSSRQQYGADNSNQRLLPPLLYAGVILEGGIISYESNIRTGGAGLRYFGAGGSGEYREDRISIYLRAISSSNGKVLKTVYTTKSILSQKINASLFRYVKLKRLLEAETGFTYNEPSHMAVKEAIEKAVISLVAEGIEDNLWNTNNPADSSNQVLTDYKLEKENIESSNTMGLKQFPGQRKSSYLGVDGGLITYEGDYKNSSSRGITNVSLGFRLTDSWYLDLKMGVSEYYADNRFNQTLLTGDMRLKYKLLPYEKITPQVALGFGIAHFDGLEEESTDMIKPYFSSEAGIELMLHRNIGLHATGTLNYLLSDKTDGIEAGEYNDFFMTTKVGLNFYSGN